MITKHLLASRTPGIRIRDFFFDKDFAKNPHQGLVFSSRGNRLRQLKRRRYFGCTGEAR